MSSSAAGKVWYKYRVTAVKIVNLAIAKGTSFSKKGGTDLRLRRDPTPSSNTILDVTSKKFFP